MKFDITGILLAGGKSRRMGSDKRYLVLGGETLFVRTLSVLQQMFQEVVVVLSNLDFEVKQPDVRVVTDLIPNCATVGGLYTGLYYATRPKVFVVACDMPFLQPPVINYLCSISPGSDITLVHLAAGIQPMHALYSKKCLPIFENMIKTENFQLKSIANETTLSIRIVQESEIQSRDPHLLSFFNLNTPEDVGLAQKMIFSK